MQLSVRDLAGERGGEAVFSDLSFTLQSGQAALVTGPNGSGKTTLIRLLAGLLEPAAGTIMLTGEDGTPQTVADACHYLGHQNALKPALSVSENLQHWQGFLGEPLLSVGEALERVGLADISALPFGYLSTGQRRRIAIARLLVSRRPIWLLDEPTAGLDAASERQFAAQMREHLSSGGMIVAATHLPLGLDDAVEVRMGQA
jgi:heme exporter protein A